jgi:3-methyl-2-oxobutanoate hydroxymethyltransferase
MVMNRTTIKDLNDKKEQGLKITMLTAYDYYTAKLVDEAGIDLILVGDSLGMVVQGMDDTLSVTVDDIIYHTRAVKKGARRSLIVADLPFMSFQISVEEAMRNAGRIIKESGAGAVKLEGGKRVVPQVEALVKAGIPVMGHLGLTPQSVNQFSGFKVQAKEKAQGLELLEDALALQKAGVFSIVLETVPLELASIVTDRLKIPTIGIGAGPDCDGQVLVFYDLLGFDQDFKPRFVRRYADLHQIINQAIKKYIADIKESRFPALEEGFRMKEDVLEDIRKELKLIADHQKH